MSNTQITDHIERQRALDPRSSFIIQAPAGSGKTELLTRRFLVLLASVSQPEEIVAITFTRKAAAEMRARIIEALLSAQSSAPQDSHGFKTWQLAKKVLESDLKQKWKLLQNPNRLRIFTIDALCARITKAAPLLSQFGSTPNVIEDATQYYSQAVHKLLETLEENHSWTQALETVLLHLDNHYQHVENLFIGMLQKRDQWLPYVAGHENLQTLRHLLEQGLENIILSKLKKCQLTFPPQLQNELLALIRFANETKSDFPDQENRIALEFFDMPGSSLVDLSKWINIAQFLLTNEFSWRKSVNKMNGFPAASSAINEDQSVLFKNMKQRMQSLLQKFTSYENLRIALQEILLLPSPYYTDKQWQTIQSLIILLPVLVAHLHIIFRNQGVVDFIAIAEGAIQALGTPEAPSDLALNLDYQIRHLLVDEFQDTSMTQFRLFELLIAGWEPNDGRTLFLVGDPMQSIYRFREAEVSLFLQVKKHGIGFIKPESLVLKTNFRSEHGMVTWINDLFEPIFPQFEEIALGSIPYNPSSAIHQDTRRQHLYFHPIFDDDIGKTEAEHIVHLINQELSQNKDTSIAILVRSRTHLESIIPTLKKAQIPFQAIEIEKLQYSVVIQDLSVLTRALLFLGDRVAWLALLRAPWCGLTLKDLHIIAFDQNVPIWQRVKHYQQLEGLSEQACIRLQRLYPILQNALANRSRQRLSDWVKQVWLSLGGPACIKESYELDNAKTFFQLLNHFEQKSEMLDFSLFEKKLETLYAAPYGQSQANVHVMTIHKAKGLEFDIVIIPALDRKPAIDDNQLLMWSETQSEDGIRNLILAPIKSLEDEYDPIYRFLRFQEGMKSRNEIIRLLYVAATRAKQCLHLVAGITKKAEDGEIKQPPNNSFLAFLWPYFKLAIPTISPVFETETAMNDPQTVSTREHNKLTRLSSDWVHPVSTTHEDKIPFSPISQAQFLWKIEYQHHIGSIIHKMLQKISTVDLNKWDVRKIADHKKNWDHALLQLGVAHLDLDRCTDMILQSISKTLSDNRGKWILMQHDQARSEFPISTYFDQEVIHMVIDRTFVDEQGVRWIIDYKTTDLIESDIEQFLIQAKTKYSPQLNAYAKAFQQLDDRPIRLGLYFPLFSGWHEWEYQRSNDE